VTQPELLQQENKWKDGRVTGQGGVDTPEGPADMKPCPTNLPQTINPEAGPKRAGVETHRNLHCQYYDHCLDEAVKRGWASFTCLKCPLYQIAAPPQMGIEAYATQRRAI
jgi:hypothetical protein